MPSSATSFKRESHRVERGGAPLEYIAISVVAAVLTSSIGAAWITHGGSGSSVGATASQIGSAAADTLMDAIRTGGTARASKRREATATIRIGALRSPVPARSTRTPRQIAWKELAASRRGQYRFGSWSTRADACLMCASWDASGSAGLAANAGIALEGQSTARAAAASVGGGGQIVAATHGQQVRGGASGRAFVGGDVRANGELIATSKRQHAELDAGGRIGAVATGEATVGLTLLGVAVNSTTEVEGWAGAGVRARVRAARNGGRVNWSVGWGAALGLGGATQWSGSVDVRGFSLHHLLGLRPLATSRTHSSRDRSSRTSRRRGT